VIKISFVKVLAALTVTLTACSQPTTAASSVMTTAWPSTFTYAEVTPVARPTPPPPPLPDRPVTTPTELIEEVVIVRYKQQGIEITPAEWQGLSSSICDDLAAGGTGRLLSDASKAATATVQHEIADLNVDGATLSGCPDLKPKLPAGVYSTSDLSDDLPLLTRVAYMTDDIKYSRLVSKYIKAVGEYGRRYDVDVSDLLAAIPGSAGGGYSTVCADGWVSSSGGKQGACSHHGGLG
jgi:hypothetical protein